MAIGCLATYTEKQLPWLNPIKIFKYPQKLCDTIEKEGFPEVICFANYVWNFNLSYEFAKLVKSERLIIFLFSFFSPFENRINKAPKVGSNVIDESIGKFILFNH